MADRKIHHLSGSKASRDFELELQKAHDPWTVVWSVVNSADGKKRYALELGNNLIEMAAEDWLRVARQIVAECEAAQ